MSLFREIWSVLTPRQRRWAVWAQLLSIVMAFSTVVGIASISPFFSVLSDPDLIHRTKLFDWLYTSFAFSSRRSFEIGLGLAFMLIVLFANMINAVGSFVMTRLSWRISTELKSTLFREYLCRPYLFHATTHSAVLFNNIIFKTSHVTNSILQNGFNFVTNAITALFIILSVVVFKPTLGAAIVLALACGYIAIYLLMRNRLLRAGQVQAHFSAEQTKVVNESLGAIKEILVLRIQNFFRDRFEQSSHAFARAATHTQIVGQSPKQIMESVAVIGLVVVALTAGGREDGVGPWLGQLTFLGFAAYRLLPALQQAFTAVVGIRANQAGFLTIAPDLRIGHEKVRVDNPTDRRWRERPRQEIRLDDVSFRYQPDRPAAALGLSLRIPARAAVGFIGANGSGKTTLVDLIAGLLPPAGGRIEVDGIIIDDANRASWQSRIAYVPQAIFLMDTTIAQNVALGVSDEAIDRGRLLAAAKLAQLDEFVATLPNGYDHLLGERGMRLSGGQRQRIGIARALYTDASVLILDEATNALDGLTEQELVATLLRLRGSYTIILIAHRLSTVRACDLIFELHNGAIVGRGTYNELLKDSGTFRRLVSLDANENEPAHTPRM
jgi:ABC-type multidrug transport system fused ATPase/permease subunit